MISKVILETCYLSDDEKRLVCPIARDEGADFVQTSTGFGPAGETHAGFACARARRSPNTGGAISDE